MRKFIVFLLALVVLFSMFGCATTSTTEKTIVQYDMELSAVRKPIDPNVRQRSPQEDTSTGTLRYAYEDDLFRSIWSASEAGWDLVLYNKTEQPIMIDWDNATYMDFDNIGHAVLISSTKYADKGNPQTPSVINRKGNITEKVVSSDHIYRSPITGAWAKKPMLPIDYAEAIRYKGKELRLIVPITVSGLSTQYEFVFKVKDVKQIPASSNPWSGYLMDRAVGSIF